MVQNDIDTSLLLAVAGVRMKESPESRANLLATLAKHPQLISSIETEKRGLLRPRGDRRRAPGAHVRPPTAHVLLYDLTTGRAGRLAHRPGTDRPVRFTWTPWLRSRSARGDRELAVGMPPPTTEPVLLLASHDTQADRPAAAWLHQDTGPRDSSSRYSHDGNTLVAMIQYYGDGVDERLQQRRGVRLGHHARPAAAVRRIVPLPAEAVQDVAVSPAGDRIYTTKPVAAYDVATGKQL